MGGQETWRQEMERRMEEGRSTDGSVCDAHVGEMHSPAMADEGVRGSFESLYRHAYLSSCERGERSIRDRPTLP